MRVFTIRGMAACLVGTLVCAAGARQALGQITYVSNLDQPVAVEGLVQRFDWFASSFTTGSDTLGYDLDSVQVGLDGKINDSGGFSVLVFSDDSGEPGTSLGALSGSTDPITAGNYTYSTSGMSLSPSTPYWIVLEAPSPASGGYLWNITTSSDYTSSDGWSIDTGNNCISYSQGTSWNPLLAEGQFTVTATTVPEPASLGVGVLTTAFLRRRRRC